MKSTDKFMQEENILNPINQNTNPADFQDQVKTSKLLRRTRILLPFQVVLLVISGFIIIPFFFASGEGLGWGLLIYGNYIILSIVALAIFGILGLINSIKLLKRKVVSSLSLSVFFVSILCLIFFLVGGMYFIGLPYFAQMKSEADQRHFQEEVIKGQKLMQQMDALRKVRSKILLEDFKKPHKIISFVSRDYTDQQAQIYVRLDNNSQIFIASIAPFKVNDLLEKLNTTELIGKEVTVHIQDGFPFTSVDSGYVCENPNFSNNTCSEDIIFIGFSYFQAIGETKPLDIYSITSCKTGWPNPSSCQK